jgi:conjugative transfer signal peptidase TraF
MKASVPFLGCAAVLVVGVSAYAAGLRVNHTPSMPMGLWIDRPGGPYRAGDIVTACPALTESQKVYLHPGNCPSGMEPVLKPVAASEGDLVAVTPSGIRVNGIELPNTAPLDHDGRGRPIAAYSSGVYQVKPGQVWLLVPHPDSFDSRYFGPVSSADVIARAIPVLTWR